MRSSLFGLIVAAVLVTAVTSTQATEKSKNGAQAVHPGISSVTDSKGNPVPLRPNVAGTVRQSGVRLADTEIQRGQDWWPYSAALPPYTAVNRRPEAMSETEIQINGVAVIDTRDAEATLPFDAERAQTR